MLEKRKKAEAAEAAATEAALGPASSVPAVAKSATAIAVQEYRENYAARYRDDAARYLDEVAPAGIAGRRIKFTKDGVYATTDDGKAVPDGVEFVVLADETQVGWIRFNGAREAPDCHMGLLFDGFVMPLRESLGDLDESAWEEGLNGQPQDPWQHQQNLVLQRTDTQELFTFSTSSKTGRKAVGNLLRHYTRMRKTHPDMLPVIKLGKGGFEHSDKRVGFVTTPVLVVVGRAPRDSAAKPDTSTAAFIEDQDPLRF
jgi:hypothetical protein